MTFIGIWILGAFLVSHAPEAKCTSPTQSDAFRLQANLNQEQPKHEKSISTFFGRIVKDGDKFVLSDAKRKVWYELDDQQTVGKFDGKTVRITGTLNTTKDLILVQSIEQASN